MIELLIAILILGVLITLLLPAWQLFVGRAQSARCMGNMKQMHAAFMLHIGDHGGRILPYRATDVAADGSGSRGNFWTVEIAPYLSEKKKCLICPAEKMKKSYYYAMSAAISSDKLNLEYVTKMTMPSRRFLLADSAGESRITRGDFLEECAFRHMSKFANVLFFDGHIEVYSSNQIPIPTNGFTKTSRDHKLFFDGSL